jgi:hypothetical protein
MRSRPMMMRTIAENTREMSVDHESDALNSAKTDARRMKKPRQRQW